MHFASVPRPLEQLPPASANRLDRAGKFVEDTGVEAAAEAGDVPATTELFPVENNGTFARDTAAGTLASEGGNPVSWRVAMTSLTNGYS